MWFIGVEVEQEASAPPPKKNPGSAPDSLNQLKVLEKNCFGSGQLYKGKKG